MLDRFATASPELYDSVRYNPRPALMGRTSSLPLAVKLPLILTLIVIGVATTVGAVMIKQDRQRLEEALKDKALTLGRSIAVIAG